MKDCYSVKSLYHFISLYFLLFKQDTLLNLEERQEKKVKRYGEIQNTAKRINELLAENMELFNMQDNQGSEIWGNYVAFIDVLMEESLFKCVACR